MWLIRFGLTNQNIFFGFCAVVFCILVLVIASIFVRACSLRYYTPGHSLSFFINFASLLVCLTILFRGVQPAWGSIYMLVNVCQIFIPPMVLGYTMLAAAVLAKSWMQVMHFRFQKNTEEYIPNFLVWILLVIAGAAVIVWEVTFMPNVHQQSVMFDNSTEPVFVCEGWSTAADNNAQFDWKVALSSYFAFLLLLAVLAVPFYLGIPKLSPIQVSAVRCMPLITVNSVMCVIAGLIVWFQYHPDPDRHDSMLYAIIGSLQLWMLFFANAALLFSEVQVVRNRDKGNLPRSRSDDGTRSKVKIRPLGSSKFKKSNTLTINDDTVDTTFHNPMTDDGYKDTDRHTYTETLPEYHADTDTDTQNGSVKGARQDYLEPTTSVYSSINHPLDLPMLTLTGVDDDESSHGEENPNYEDDEHPSY